ncbi:MAG: hypothetical protein D6775_07800 [Caldilineae bacterium]|nr:MAG: hypothetical protein D6775_07800 [Caldilineae bacterium]
MKKHRYLPLFLLLALMLLAACASPQVQDNEAAVEAAVEATLTAVAPGAGGDVPAPTEAPTATLPPTEQAIPTDTPEPEPQPASEQPEQPAPVVIMPPTVADFAPALIPAKAMGDPEAPVVMYEWSDYT